MKKRIAITSFCAMICGAMLLSGCGSQTSEPTGSQPTDNVVVSTISLPGEVEESTPSSVSTLQQTIQKGDVTITYAEVLDVDSRVNDLLMNDTKLFLQYGLTDSQGNELPLSGDMGATVIQHGDTLCVVTTGVLTDKQGNKELMAYTTNIDLTTGDRASTGIRENADKAAELIAKGKVEIMEADEGKKAEISAYLKNLGKKKLTSILSKCDFTGEEKLPKSFSYFLNGDTDEIGVYVPVSDALGHYAIVLIERDALL